VSVGPASHRSARLAPEAPRAPRVERGPAPPHAPDHPQQLRREIDGHLEAREAIAVAHGLEGGEAGPASDGPRTCDQMDRPTRGCYA
jgi:hypothetical protein